MVDYLVVGLGLAGVAFCERLERAKKTFIAISDTSQQASLVAGGLYNPVILKRFTLAWKADYQLELALPFYQALEQKLGISFDDAIPVLRRFTSIEEQNNWFAASDTKGLEPFLTPQILPNQNPAVQASFGYGEVKHTGKLNTRILLEAYSAYLEQKERLHKTRFEYAKLVVQEESVQYGAITAKQVVFAEGYGLKQNPYFSYLPLNGTKGELLTIKAPNLKEDKVIKSSIFCIPLGNHLYRVGATYKWKDKSNSPTVEAKQELLEKLDTLIKCEYEVMEHVAGIRPTVADRRPLVGRHPKYNNLFVLNGFGSRGVLIAPYASKQLLEHIERGTQMDSEMDIARYVKKYTD